MAYRSLAATARSLAATAIDRDYWGYQLLTLADPRVSRKWDARAGWSFVAMSAELCAVKALNMASRLWDAEEDPKVAGSFGSLYRCSSASMPPC